MSLAHRERTLAAGPHRRSVRMPALVGAFCAVVYVLTAGYGMTSGDVAATHVLAWQIGSVGDPTFTPDTYPPLDKQRLRDIWVIHDSRGEEIIGRSPGAVAAAVPAYMAAGDRSFSPAPGAVTAALLSSVSVGLIASCLQRLMRTRDAGLATVAFALGTPVWSVAADGMWPHTVTVLGICGMAWAASRERWWLVGLFGGVAIWGRLHVAVIVAIVGLAVGWRRRDPLIVARVASASAGLLALNCWWSRWLYGSWNPMSPYAVSISDNPFNTQGSGLVNQLGFWVAPDRGILIWTPILLLLAPALIRQWRDLPDWAKALLWGGLAYTFVQGMRNPFGGGDGFYGYRLTLELLACVTPAFALSARSMGRAARSLFGPLLAFQVATICVGAILGGFVSPAEDVWTTHTLISALVTTPVALAVFVFLCLALGVLGHRIWHSPDNSTQ